MTDPILVQSHRDLVRAHRDVVLARRSGEPKREARAVERLFAARFVYVAARRLGAVAEVSR